MVEPASEGWHVTGGTLAGLTLEATKKLALKVLKPCYNAVPLLLRRVWQPPIHNLDQSSGWAAKGIPVDVRGIPWDILTTSRFLSYACLSWIVNGGCFWVFRYLGW